MSSPGAIDEVIRRQRREVLAIERRIAAQLMAEHRAALRRLERLVGDVRRAMQLAGQIHDAERWMRENVAARALLELAEQQGDEFGRFAASEIEARRLELIGLAEQHADDAGIASLLDGQPVPPATMSSIAAAFSSIPVEAVQATVAALGPGSPLRALFDTFGPDASRKLGEALVSGITRGQGAAQVARAMRASLDGNAARALTIARTELHRSYRSSTLDRYRGKPNVYSGWSWHANLDTRTCPACIALHGSVHELSESFGGHPSCRCRPLPITRDLSSIIGDSPEARELQERIDGARSSRPTGAEWFAGLSPDEQRAIVGPLKLGAMRDGRITLADVYVDRVDPVWGRSHSTASLRQAEANAARRG